MPAYVEQRYGQPTEIPSLAHENTTEGLGAIYAYDSLTSPESQTVFDRRIKDEQQVIGDARIALEEREEEADHRKGELESAFSTGSIGEAEFESSRQEVLNDYGRIDAYEKSLRNVESFAREREDRWRFSGGMSFMAEDPEAKDLITATVESAVTENQPFMDDTLFNSMVDETQPLVYIDALSSPLEFPLSAVVSAWGFQSWETGRGGYGKKGGRASADVIEEYASRGTELPPVDHAKALILESGKVIILTSDAHRVGAAKLRGDGTVRIKKLEIVRSKQSNVNLEQGLGTLVMDEAVQNAPVERAKGSSNMVKAHSSSRWQRFATRWNLSHSQKENNK